MPVKCTNHIPVARDMIVGEMAEALNRAAKEHQTTSRLLAPIDTGFLRENIKVTQRATKRRPQAAVVSGAPYSAAVNYGRRAPDGSFAAGLFFWEEGVEAGRRALMEEAVKQANSRGSRRKTGVQHADTPEQLEAFFFNEGL